MAHSVILLGVDELQGENTTGTGTLEALRDHMPAVEAIEEIELRSPAQEAVLAKAEDIASKFVTAGFTPAELSTDTEELGNLITAA